MRWLIGSWDGNNGQGAFRETWSAESDTLMHHITYLTGADGIERPVGAGFIRVIDGQIYYTKDAMQDEAPVRWKLADCDAKRLRFHNGHAPYYQDIAFERTANDRLRLQLTTGKDSRDLIFSRGTEYLSSLE